MPRNARNGTAGDQQPATGRAAADSPVTVDSILDWRDGVLAEIRRRPARSLLVAVGTGYLAGGGLGTILTARLLSLGARIAMRLAIIPVLADGIERAVFDGRGADTPVEAKAPNTKQLPNQKEMES